MKLFIYIFLLLLVSLESFANEKCEIDYLKFCEHQDSRIPNMCPHNLGDGLKKTCVVSWKRAKSIQKICARELKAACRGFIHGDFLSQYICLTNPEKWNTFSDDCLKSLVKGNPHHKR
jgi:hypothetical protein